MRKLVSAAATAAMLLSATAAKAAVITYIFTGTGSGSLDGTPFDGSFTVTMVSDTSTVTSGGGELRNTGTTTFVSGALTDTISDAVLIENTASPGFMGFGQSISPFPDKSLTATVFETYNLINSLPLTTGGLSVAPATFITAGGTLVFSGDRPITALSFEATGGVPEASTWAMMLAGFAGLGFLAYRKRASLAAA